MSHQQTILNYLTETIPTLNETPFEKKKEKKKKKKKKALY
jgi:hypothetical protein